MNEKLSFIVELKQTVDQEIAKIKRAAVETKSSVSSAFSSIKGYIVGAFTVTAVTAFARSVLDYVGKIKDAAAATGISTTQFQALSMVARENGVEMDTLVMSLGRLRDIQGSIGSDTQLQDTFTRLGIAIGDVESADPDVLLQRIAKSIRDTGDASAAFDIFGRNAARLIPVLDELADGWDSMVERTRNGLISEEDIAYIDRMGDAMDNAGTMAKSWAANVIGAVVDISAVLGRMSAGSGLQGAFHEEGQERYNQKKAAEEKKARDKELREQLARKRAAAEESRNLGKAKDEGAALTDQFAKSNLSAKDYEARMQQRVNDLVAEANREGLTALQRQTAQNEALKASLELLEAQKRVKSEADEADNKKQRAAEQMNRQLELNASTNEKIRDYRVSKMTPEKQLKVVESDIARDRKELNAGPLTPKRRAELVDNLIESDRKRGALRKEIEESSSKGKGDAGSRAEKIKAAQENIAKARQRSVGGEDLAGYFQRVSDLRRGKAPQDNAAQQTAENTRIIAENTAALKEMGVAKP